MPSTVTSLVKNPCKDKYKGENGASLAIVTGTLQVLDYY